jgi:hypothetical protein
MAKRVASRHRRRAQDVARRQLLQSRERLLLAQAGGDGGEVEVPRVAGDRRPPREPARELAQAGDLLPECGGHGRGHTFVVERPLRGPARARPGQLLEVERIAAALAVHLLPNGRRQPFADQRARIAGGQRA